MRPLIDWRYEFIRTPLEQPLLRLRRLLGLRQRLRHPELREIHLEDGRIDAVIGRLLTPSSNCVDIGSHFGSMLSRFCRLAPSGRHVAFEVIPEKVLFLRRKFPEVDVRQMALSDHSGTGRFYIDRKATGFSSLAHTDGTHVDEVQVELACLDEVLPQDRRFDVLKLDVEGAELFVLRGGRGTLAQHRPAVVFECGPGGPPAFGYSPGDIHDFFTREAGFSVLFLKDYLGGGRPVERETFEEACTRYPFRAFNWIALPSR